MSNTDAVSNWVKLCVTHAFENNFTLVGLHEYIDGAVRAKYELLRDDYVGRNPKSTSLRLPVGSRSTLRCGKPCGSKL